MKPIKKIILVCLLFANTAMADRIEFMPTSTLKGPQGKMIKMITEQVKLTDIQFVPSLKNGCGEAVNIFNTTKDPVAIIWSDTNIRTSNRTKQNCMIDFNTAKPIIVASETYEFCTLSNVSLSKKAVNRFGIIISRPTNELLRLMNSNKQGYTFKNVTYKSSNAVLQAILNREVEIGMLSTGAAKNAVKAGTIKCLYTTGSSQFGQQPVSKFFGEPSPLSEIRLGMMMFVRNFTPEQIKKLEQSLDKRFIAKLEKSDLFGVKVGIDLVAQEAFINTAKDKARYQ
jgi:hypothetical protein